MFAIGTSERNHLLLCLLFIRICQSLLFIYSENVSRMEHANINDRFLRSAEQSILRPVFTVQLHQELTCTSQDVLCADMVCKSKR